MNTRRLSCSLSARSARNISRSEAKTNSDVLVLGTAFFFCLTYMLLGLTDGLLVSQGVSASNILVRLKYPCMLATIGCGLLHMVLTKSTSIFCREFVQVFGVGVVFTFISAIEIIYTSRIGASTVDNLLKLMLPVLMAYCVLNTLSFELLQRSMFVVLLSSVAGYICELSFGDVTFADIMQSDFNTSSSPLESSIFAGMSITLCFYYCYYRSNKLLTVIGFIYAIATFKRAAIVFAVVALVLPLFVNVNKKIGKRFIWILALVTLIATGIYYLMLLPANAAMFERLFNQKQSDFTMGRSAFLDTLLRRDFIPFGFGSSGDIIGRSMEMDLIEIAIELTPLALILFVLAYWNICRRNLYCVIVMVYEFSNFITSHSLNSNYKWGICFIMIGMITYMPRSNSEDIGWFAAQMKGMSRFIRS